jgi:hypothetical protein
MTISDLYRWACGTESDINQHLPRLSALAALCDTIVELGVRGGESTKALLNGLDERHKTGPRGFRILYSYDINDCGNQRIRDAVDSAIQIEWQLHQADSRTVEIPECELLFIDTLHTADQLRTELTRHHGKVSKWIVLHDTETFAVHGEGGGEGLIVGLMDFLHAQKRSEWRIINMVSYNNGLTVLERIHHDYPVIPRPVRQLPVPDVPSADAAGERPGLFPGAGLPS